MPGGRPSLFIGSSAEGLPVAKAIQVLLDHSCAVTIWSQGVFGLSKGTLESLVEAANSFDFAALVLTPDDLVQQRESIQMSARDNVLFELGLFMGALGRARTFVVHERGSQLKLPSDLAGVTTATFAKHASGNLKSALGAASTLIEEAVAKEGLRKSHGHDATSRDAGPLRQRQQEFVMYGGVKLRRKPSGGFENVAYCPSCEVGMATLDRGTPFVCGKCNSLSGFDSGRLSEIVREAASEYP